MSLMKQWSIVSHVIGALLSLVAECVAGTPREKAIAAVAVARAQVTIANERPQLPDTRNRFPGASAGDFRQELDVARAELAEFQAKSNEKAWKIAELKIANAAERQGKSSADSTTSLMTLINNPAETVPARSPTPMAMSFPKVAVVSEVLPAQLVIGVRNKGCAPCKRLEKDIASILTPKGWQIGDGSQDQIQFVHLDDDQFAPKITLYQNGQILKTWDGYQDPAMLSRELRLAWDGAGEHPQAVSMANGVAGAIQASTQIRNTLDYFRRYVGEGNQTTLEWDCNRDGKMSLFAMGEWTAPLIFGTDGRIELAAPNAINLPVKQLAFAYRIRGSDVIVDGDPVALRGLADKLGTAKGSQIVGAMPVGIVGIDDMLLWYNVFSMFRDIFSLLHPSCDVVLPGQIIANATLNGDSLIVAFDKAPSVKLVWLFTFSLTVKRVTISQSNIHVEFSGSRWIKSRDFAVQ